MFLSTLRGLALIWIVRVLDCDCVLPMNVHRISQANVMRFLIFQAAGV